MQEAIALEWRRSPLIPILVIQIALLALIGLANIGVNIPIMGQLVALIYLLFIPGTLVLLILDVSNLNPIEALLYSVGLSLVALMLTGLALNTFGPTLGVQRPLSLMPLVTAMTALTLSLCGLWYARTRGRFHPYVIRVPRQALPSALLLCLLPFLSIFGAYLLNYFQAPALLMWLIIIIALLVILAGVGRFVSRELYPLAIFVIAVSLLYQVSLVSTYLVGYDVQIEYNVASLVVSNGYWITSIPSNYNAMLALAIIAPALSQIGGIDMVWVFKALYPLLFALVPLGLFRVFQKQVDDKIAFLSVFFFMSVFAFYAEMPQLAREEVAELFIVLLLLLVVDRAMSRAQRSAFFVVFGFGLITSHYGLSYIFMFIMAAALVVMFFLSAQPMTKLRRASAALFTRSGGTSVPENSVSRQLDTRLVTPSLLVLFVVLTLAWYMSFSSGTALQLLSGFVNQITGNISTTFLDPATRESVAVATSPQSPLREVTLYLGLVTQFLAVVGIIFVVLKRKEWHIDDGFLAFAIAFFAVVVASVVVPNLTTFLSFRFFQATLLLVAPFFVIGWTRGCQFVCDALRTRWTLRRREAALSGVAVFLAVFLIFNSGLAYQIANDNPTTASFNPNVDAAVFNQKEIAGATWLVSRVSNTSILGSDATGVLLLYGKDPAVLFLGQDKRDDTIAADTEGVPQGTYIFLRSHVIETGQIFASYQSTQYVNLTSSVFYSNVLSNTSKIYDDGGSQVYV
jgi:uncharacterized membrane protein